MASVNFNKSTSKEVALDVNQSNENTIYFTGTDSDDRQIILGGVPYGATLKDVNEIRADLSINTNSLRDDLMEVRTSIVSLQDQNTILNNRINDLQDQIHNLDQSDPEILNKLSVITESINGINREIDNLNNQLNEITITINDADSAESQIEELRNKINSFNLSLGCDIGILRYQSEQGDRDLHDSIENLRTGDVGLLKYELRKLEQSNTQAVNALNELTSEVQALRINLNLTVPIGGIIMWFSGAIPVGYTICDGRTVNGITTPDLRGRFIIGGNFDNPGVPMHHVGDKGGKERISLSIENLPEHSHSYSDSSSISSYSEMESSKLLTGTTAVKYSVIDSAESDSIEKQTTSAGLGESFEIIPPYYALTFIMRVN